MLVGAILISQLFLRRENNFARRVNVIAMKSYAFLDLGFCTHFVGLSSKFSSPFA